MHQNERHRSGEGRDPSPIRSFRDRCLKELRLQARYGLDIGPSPVPYFRQPSPSMILSGAASCQVEVNVSLIATVS